MSYQALARTWRPKNFQTLVGQEHVVQALTNALDHNQLHHAYLFTGTRGSGKTTIARIFAKCLNCETGITSKPCDTCDTCRAIDEGRFLDLIEVDAASRTRVEETRELLDNVQYRPTQGRMKIYLIDEVHMLSNSSFNALLKTLEEPPAHVKFLLATTDPDKLPVTVLSRCLQFHLKHLSVDQITQQLEHIVTAEKIAFEPGAMKYLGVAAKGSMRDGLSLLDQAIAFSNQHLSLEAVKSMLGVIEKTHTWNILESLAQKNGVQLFESVATLAEHTSNFERALDELLSALHHIALEQIVPNSLADETMDSEKIQHYAKAFTPEEIQLFYQIGVTGRRDLNLAPTLRIGFEMILMRMLAFEQVTVEQPAAKPVPIISAAPKITPAKPSVAPVTSTPHKAPPSKPTQSSDASWPALIAQLNLSGITLSLANNCALKSLSDGQIELVLTASHAPMLNDRQKQRLEEALSKHFNKPYRVVISITGIPEAESPAATAKRISLEKHEQAHDNLLQDPALQEILKNFDAELDPSLIKAE